MSLIPNESYSFPDYFVRTVRSSKKPGEKISPSSAMKAEPLREPILEPPASRSEARREKVASPSEVKAEKRAVSQVSSEPPPSRPAAPREIPRSVTPPPPVVRKAPVRTSIPAVVHLKRKVRYNTHLIGPEQAPPDKKAVLPASPLNGVPQKRELPQLHGPVQPVRANKVANLSVQAPAPRPAVTAIQPLPQRPPPPLNLVPNGATAEGPADEQIEFELPDSVPFYPSKSRRKLVHFLVCEGTAIVALILFAILGLSRTFSGRAAGLSINILTVAAAVAATLIPIFFYAIGPTLPRDDH